MVCSSDFKGVFSADCIPHNLAAISRFIIVINLGTRKGVRGKLPVGHFVTLVASPTSLIYIDPFGLPNMQPDINIFLQLCKRKNVYVNLRQIQHFNSVYCGFYAILFACYFDKQYHSKKKLFSLHFKNSNLYKNDSLCVEYLRRIKIMK